MTSQGPADERREEATATTADDTAAGDRQHAPEVEDAVSAAAVTTEAPATEVEVEQGDPDDPIWSPFAGDLWTTYWGERHSVAASVFYHGWRAATWQRIHTLIVFLSLLLSSAAFGMLLGTGSTFWPKVFAIVTAALQAFDMSVRPSKQAEVHEVLRSRYSDLTARLLDVRDGQELDHDLMAAFVVDREHLEAREPPEPNIVLLASAQFREADSRGEKLGFVRPGRFAVWLARWFGIDVWANGVPQPKV